MKMKAFAVIHLSLLHSSDILNNNHFFLSSYLSFRLNSLSNYILSAPEGYFP